MNHRKGAEPIKSKSYRAIQLIPIKPSGLVEWLRVIWGADVWIWHVPLVKVGILLSVVFVANALSEVVVSTSLKISTWPFTTMLRLQFLGSSAARRLGLAFTFTAREPS